MTDLPRGVLHRHEDGREHRHFAAGFTVGGQTVDETDGTENHEHGYFSVYGRSSGGTDSGPVVWVSDYEAGER